MFNTRNQLDKIIITAMDRFVWFVLLVVISHLVTELTRVTGYSRGPRQDVVTVNDSSIQPIRVQSLVLYPGQEYGLYEQQNQQYYSDSNPYSSYANNNNTNNNNFLSSLFNQFTNNNKNGQQQQQQPTPSDGVKSNNLLNNMPTEQINANFFSFRPLIDSIFEIPISTLRAVNDLVRRLTGGYQQPRRQKQQQQETDQSEPIKYFAYPSSLAHYATQRSTNAMPPKTQFELLNRKQPTTEAAGEPTDASSTPLAKSVLNDGVQS